MARSSSLFLAAPFFLIGQLLSSAEGCFLSFFPPLEAMPPSNRSPLSG